MSALVQKQTSAGAPGLSAKCQKRTLTEEGVGVAAVPMFCVERSPPPQALRILGRETAISWFSEEAAK